MQLVSWVVFYLVVKPYTSSIRRKYGLTTHVTTPVALSDPYPTINGIFKHGFHN